MNQQDNIPLLTDLIEKGIEIKLSDLGLDQDFILEQDGTQADFELNEFSSSPSQVSTLNSADSDQLLADHPLLEAHIREILDRHMEQVWQEIRAAIRDAENEGDSE